MSSRQVYRFQRGEPIVIGRRVLSGDPSGFDASALLKSTSGYRIPAEGDDAAATFLTEFVDAAEDEPAHWLFWIPAEVAGTLELGRYATDVKFMRDGETVLISDPAFIVIVESISG
ncbi:MAG: hypothetical protein IPG83_09265 [Novosphingobium sp.]|mgnify:FL=1|nr:hypothetical protein [Novosphingobium sp.]